MAAKGINDHDCIGDFIRNMHENPLVPLYPALSQQDTQLVLRLLADLGVRQISVFASVLMALETYLNRYELHHCNDFVLVASGLVLLIDKLHGIETNVPLNRIRRVLFNFTGRTYSRMHLKQLERTILIDLNYTLPLYNVVEDQIIVIERFIRLLHTSYQRFYKLICTTSFLLLQIVLINWKQIFTTVQNIYQTVFGNLKYFTLIVQSRFYIPTSVFVVALKLIANGDWHWRGSLYCFLHANKPSDLLLLLIDSMALINW